MSCQRNQPPTTRQSDQNEATNPASGESKGVDVSVTNWLTRSGAEASFNFEDASDSSVDEVSTSNSVFYTP